MVFHQCDNWCVLLENFRPCFFFQTGWVWGGGRNTDARGPPQGHQWYRMFPRQSRHLLSEKKLKLGYFSFFLQLLISNLWNQVLLLLEYLVGFLLQGASIWGTTAPSKVLLPWNNNLLSRQSVSPHVLQEQWVQWIIAQEGKKLCLLYNSFKHIF